MRLAILAALAALVLPVAAQADCAADAAELAERVGASTELPQARPEGARPEGARPEAPATNQSRGVPPEAMARSGGVIAPPEQGRGRVIEPPPSAVAPSMPTAPQIRPEPRQGDIQSGAARTAQVESLLTAARKAAERGDETECARRVEEARALADPG